MFYLFRSRRRAMRIVLGLVVGSVAISMLLYLIPGFGSATGQTGETVLAEVGGEDVTLTEAQETLSEAARTRRLPPGATRFLAPQVVNDLVTEKALHQEAERLGLHVTEAELAQLLRNNVPVLFPNGKFVGREGYAAFVQQTYERSVPQFEALLKNDMTMSKLRRVVVDSVIVSQAELEQEYRRRNEKVRVEWAAISPASIESSVSVTPAEAEDYYNKNKTVYTIPERRSFQYIVVDDTRVSPRIQITPQEIERYYNENKDRYRVQDRAKVAHILFKTTDKKEDEIKKIEAKAQDVLKQARAGKDFGELAKASSDDQPTAAKGGEIGWITRGQTVPEFEQKAFTMKPGEISDLVKTQYGFHILKLEDRETARTKPFSEAQAAIRDELMKDRLETEKSRLAEAVRAAANKAGQNLDAAAREVGLPVLAARQIERNGPLPEAGAEPVLLDALFTAGKGAVVGPIQMTGKSVVALVTDVQPSHQGQFSEVADRAKTDARAAKARELAESRARQLLEKAKALNGDLKKAAKGFSVEVKTSDLVTRNGSIAGLGSAATIAAAFTSPPHSLQGPVQAGADEVVYKVVEKQDANMAGFEGESKAIKDTLLGSRQNEAFEVFKDELRERLKKEGKIKIYQDRVDRFVTASRG